MVGTKVASREVELIHKPIVVRIAVCNSIGEVESLVIVNQNVTVNTFPGLVPHRPSHHGSGLLQAEV